MRTLETTSFDSFDQIFKQYLRPNKPVLIKNAFSSSGVFSWSPQTLKKRVGDTKVQVNFAEKGKFEIDQVKGGYKNEPVSMKFSDYVDRRLGNKNYYLQQISVEETFPELLRDIPVGELLEPDSVNATAVNLWMGSTRSVTPLHYDFGNNFFIQCFGRKKFVLFEADQIEYLYPHEIGKHAAPHISQVDINTPDFDSFPKYKDADPIEVTVEAGDILFLPSTTWHQVVGESTSISVNIWFQQYDFQCLLPTFTRFIPQNYAVLPELTSNAIAYQFSNMLGLCDQLLSQKYYFEASLSYLSLLEFSIRKIFVKKDISIPHCTEEARLVNNINQAIEFDKLLLSSDTFSAEDIETMTNLFKSGKEMLDMSNVNWAPDQLIDLCKNIKSMILLCAESGNKF